MAPTKGLTFERTDCHDSRFVRLVQMLDEELKVYDGELHTFYNQYNGISQLDWVLLGLVDQKVAGCGAIKRYDAHTLEIKRMYVHPRFRRLGLAVGLVRELEKWSEQLGFTTCILETGKVQRPAVQLYERLGYCRIDNYGPYRGMKASICFSKNISESSSS